MSDTKKIIYLFITIISICFLPWLASLLYHKGEFPEGFFIYPPVSVIPRASINWYAFIVITLIFVLIPTILYMYPRLFGFKKPEEKTKTKERKKIPIWFWLGLMLWGSTVFLQWTHNTSLLSWLHWSDIPLFWGCILMIDGWVYVRTGGVSMISKAPQELLGISLASIPGWMLYEFINFFVDNYWYYPYANLMTRQEILIYALITSAGLMPLAFEWYCLFKTFPSFSRKYSNGPKIIFSEKVKTYLLVLGFTLMFITGLFPEQMFITMWISIPITLAAVLDKLKIWTPILEIGKGNWSPILLFALTYLLEGFILEFQNFFSVAPDSQPTFIDSPLYWKYEIPYVGILHVFEMPLLGYAGYLPFGIFCWLWWIAFAKLLNIPIIFNSENPLEKHIEKLQND
ncbi:hypothetical protein [Aquimarina sp. RZ0]|uniref:hypothetical protein n=1 Tax=Aquimarina sp. RZ0 TaxID=2607730 RepID=UPI0011F35056|nr:hypothetical protein [Aquimarina sp. RZ0]KAA1245316.1 hypothetical protein F0000_12400 [Aquimarina sp. RZ0]